MIKLNFIVCRFMSLIVGLFLVIALFLISENFSIPSQISPKGFLLNRVLRSSNLLGDQPLTDFEKNFGKENPLDGCYHVYLDVGSNIGIQVRKLF